MKLKTVILSSYFTKKRHPNDPNDPHVIGRNEHGFIENNNFNYIKEWWGSVPDTVNAFVIHDNLSEEFIKEYSRENINFIRCSESAFSNNDHRFFCFDQILKQIECDYVFHTDISDVIIVKDPSELIQENPQVSFFTCKDSIKLNQFPYLDIHEQLQFKDTKLFKENQEKWDLINMGVVGGTYENMRRFYSEFCKLRIAIGHTEFNADMWLLQYLIRSIFKDKNFITGEPVCSNFKKFEKTRKDVYFIHK